MPEGTPLSRTDKTVSAIGRKLAELPGVDRVAANVGMSREGGGGVARRKENRADLHLKLTSADRATEGRILEDVRRVFQDFESERRVLRHEGDGIYVMVDMEKLQGAARAKALDGVRSIMQRLESDPASPSPQPT